MGLMPSALCRRCSDITATTYDADDEGNDPANRPEEEYARHRCLDRAVMLIRRKFLDQKITRNTHQEIAADAIKETDAESLQRDRSTMLISIFYVLGQSPNRHPPIYLLPPQTPVRA